MKKPLTPAHDPFSVEIKGSDVILRQGSNPLLQIGLAEFVDRLTAQHLIQTFPDGSSLPDGVRFVYRRGSATLLVLEQSPQVRQVSWIAPSSPAAFGVKATYRTVTLAFPYIVIFILFKDGCLTGLQQLFYRNTAICSWDDELSLCNLLNVAEAYGLKSWLCLANMGDLSRLRWNKKVEKVIEHFWQAGFNLSSEHHEGHSYWDTTIKMKLDSRLSSLEKWAKATREDPLFMLGVPWRPAGVTVKQVAGSLLSMGCAMSPVRSTSDLITLICSGAAVPHQRRLSQLRSALLHLSMRKSLPAEES